MRIFFLIIVLFFCVNIFSQTNKVAILDFENTSGKSEYDALGKSLSNMIITDLKNNIHHKKVEFYERAQLNKLLEEQKLQKSKNFDAKTAVDFGKLSGVNYVFVGAVFVLEGNCNITTKLVDVKTSKIIVTKEVNGKIESWLSLKSELAETIAKELNSPINLENKYKTVSTSLSTLNQYGKILSTMDTGDSEKAEEMRALFEETNPDFKYFKDIKDDIEKLKQKVAELENVNSILTNDFELGDKAITKLDFNNTIKYFEKFIDNPGNQDYIENKKLYAYGKLAFSYFKKGDFENALKNARNANNIYRYYPETNEIELMSLLKLNKNVEAKNKYMVILDSLNFENELSFRRENKNKLLVWKSMDGLFYGLIGKNNQDDNQDDEDFWCYRGMPKSGYSSPPKNEFKIKTILKENNIDFNILEQGISQYIRLEKKIIDLNFPEIFSSDQILNFYKLSVQYAEELYKQKDFNTYKKHLEKEIRRMENFGIPCEEGCSEPYTKIPLRFSDKLGKKANEILWNLGLSNSMKEFYDEFGVIYGKFIFSHLIELIRQDKSKDAAIIYRNFSSIYVKDTSSYFYSSYWDVILGLRIINEEFNSRFELSPSEFEKKLNKKIENKLKEQKIPFVNFENVKKEKI
jgi:TolB-like protein